MAITENLVVLMGKIVGNGPEMKSTEKGAEFAALTLATLRQYKDKSGEWQDRSDSHNLVAFSSKLVGLIRSQVKKGSILYVRGELQKGDVIVNELILLSDSAEKSNHENLSRTNGSREQMTAAVTENLAIVLGKIVGNGPEVKSTEKGVDFVTLTIATLRQYKDKNGEWQDRSDSHNVVAFNPTLTKVIRAYVKKGSMLYVLGELQKGNVIVNELILLPNSAETSSRENQSRTNSSYANSSHANVTSQSRTNGSYANNSHANVTQMNNSNYRSRNAYQDRQSSAPPSPPNGRSATATADRPRPRGNGYDSLPGFKGRERSSRPNGASREAHPNHEEMEM